MINHTNLLTRQGHARPNVTTDSANMNSQTTVINHTNLLARQGHVRPNVTTDSASINSKVVTAVVARSTRTAPLRTQTPTPVRRVLKQGDHTEGLTDKRNVRVRSDGTPKGELSTVNEGSVCFV